MAPATAGCIADSTDKQKGRVATQPSATFFNTDNAKDSNRSAKTQPLPRERKPLLTFIRPKHPARILVDIGIAASMQEAAQAAKIYDALLAAKEHFYKSRGRRVPTEAEIDAQRYPAPRQHKGGSRHAY